MKNMKNTLLSFCLFAATGVMAQTTPRVIDPANVREGEHVEYCITHKKMKEALADPAIAAQYAAAQAATIAQEMDKSKPTGSEKSTVYTIPVVFHILHNGGVENISDAQIIDAMAILNRDYRLLNADANNVQSDFAGMPSDIEIEFALARKAPDGTCFSGITRTLTSLTSDGSNGQAQVNAVVAGNDVYQGVWPHTKYLNVYVCADIGGAAGYTFNPMGNSTASAQNMYFNGVFVLHDYTGSIGTSSPGTSRTLTHEVGHWLNLSHVWGPNNDPGNAASCSEDDGVQDTPICIGVTACSLQSNTCNDLTDPSNFSSWTYDVKDNVENYMDYSYCSKMFTPGQKTRMRNAIVSSTAGRSTIITTQTQTATGIFLPLVLCQAKFTAEKTTLCAGDSITFTDQSFNAATGWSWTFAGGSPATSTAQNPTVTFATPGTYTITLTATDGSTSDVETKTNYITVLPIGEGIPFFEGFETISDLTTSNRWIVNNLAGNGWQVTSTAAHTGSKSAKLTNFGQSAGNVDELISKAVDLSSITSATGVTLSFRYAYRKRQSTNTDILKVMLTSSCGDVWDVRKTLTATTMSGTNLATTTWTPTATDWVTVHMTNVTSQYWIPNFRFKFEFTAQGGNNVYLDDINLYAGGPSDNLVTAGLEDNPTLASASLFPNPADNEVNVRFNALSNEVMTVKVTNLSGQTLQQHYIQTNQGENIVVLETANLAAGVYMVLLTEGAYTRTMQFVVK
jgi:PKD repeat protein